MLLNMAMTLDEGRPIQINFYGSTPSCVAAFLRNYSVLSFTVHVVAISRNLLPGVNELLSCRCSLELSKAVQSSTFQTVIFCDNFPPLSSS